VGGGGGLQAHRGELMASCRDGQLPPLEARICSLGALRRVLLLLERPQAGQGGRSGGPRGAQVELQRRQVEVHVLPGQLAQRAQPRHCAASPRVAPAAAAVEAVLPCGEGRRQASLRDQGRDPGEAGVRPGLGVDRE
jgi:hypothetical protein